MTGDGLAAMSVPPSPPVFQVEHLSVVYAKRREVAAVTILSDVSVTVERAGALTLVGPSGSCSCPA